MKRSDSQDFEKLQQEMNQKALDELNTGDGLQNLFVFTLNNFAYRYLLDDQTQEPKALPINAKHFQVRAKSSDMKSALKTETAQIRDGIVRMIQDVGMKDAKIETALGIQLISNNQIEIYASVNWDCPNFNNDENKFFLKKEIFEFEDFLELRNNLANKVEAVAEIF